VSEPLQTPGEPGPNDIVFDCPHCGKSLAIDQRGAGIRITCPDCTHEVQVPGLPPDERGESEEEIVEEIEMPADAAQRVEALEEALDGAQQKIERLVGNLEEVRERRRFLEKLRTDNMARFKTIGKELETIQNAMDRIVALLQDAAADNGLDEE